MQLTREAEKAGCLMLNTPSKKQHLVLDMLFHGQEILDKVHDSTELESSGNSVLSRVLGHIGPSSTAQ